MKHHLSNVSQASSIKMGIHNSLVRDWLFVEYLSFAPATGSLEEEGRACVKVKKLEESWTT